MSKNRKTANWNTDFPAALTLVSHDPELLGEVLPQAMFTPNAPPAWFMPRGSWAIHRIGDSFLKVGKERLFFLTAAYTTSYSTIKASVGILSPL